MKLTKKLIVSVSIFLTAVSIEIHAVTFDGTPVDVSVTTRLSDSTFHIYEPPYKAMWTYREMSEAKNLTPEELLTSIASESNQEWVDYNNAKGKSHTVSKKQFEFRRNRSHEKNYFELAHKFKFSLNGVETVIVKYWFIDDGKKNGSTTLQAQKIDGKWVSSPVVGLDKLSLVIDKLDSNILASFFSSIDKDPLISDLYVKTRGDRNILNIDKLYDTLISVLKTDKNRLKVLMGD